MSDKLPIWNVTTVVVELIAAPTAEAAQEVLRKRLDKAGLTEFIDTDKQSVFESEPLDPDEEAAIRADSRS